MEIVFLSFWGVKRREINRFLATLEMTVRDLHKARNDGAGFLATFEMTTFQLKF
jgi:hypothetical protein